MGSEDEPKKNVFDVSEKDIQERAQFYLECGWDVYKIEQCIQSGFFKEDIIRDRQGEIENQKIQEERQKQYESDLITSKHIAKLKLKSNPIHQQKLREEEAKRNREIRQMRDR